VAEEHRWRPLAHEQGVRVYGDPTLAPIVERARAELRKLLSGVWSDPGEARVADLGGCRLLVFRVRGDDFLATLTGSESSRPSLEWLTPRERQVVEQVVVYGRTHEEVAALLGIAVGTVRNHLYSASAKGLARGTPLPHARDSADGGDPLRDREHFSLTEVEIARLAARGRRNAEIATIVGLSAVTVGCYVSRICKKLGVRGRIELAARLAGLDAS
jgi:DNA-binding NarL/FixJ family response regulator